MVIALPVWPSVKPSSRPGGSQAISPGLPVARIEFVTAVEAPVSVWMSAPLLESVALSSVRLAPAFAIAPLLLNPLELTIVVFVSETVPPSKYAAPPSQHVVALFSNVTPVPVTVPLRVNSAPPTPAALWVKDTSVMLSVPEPLLTAPPNGVPLPKLSLNSTLRRVTVAPLLNSAPPPLALIVLQPLEQFSSSSSMPPVKARPSIVTVPPSVRRIRARLPNWLLPEFAEPSIVVAVTPSPCRTSDLLMMMLVPCVSLYVFAPSTIVSSGEAAATAWRNEHWPPFKHSPAPDGSSVTLTVMSAWATAADASKIDAASSGATRIRRILKMNEPGAEVLADAISAPWPGSSGRRAG